MRRMQGMRGMFNRIPGNVLILSFRGMFEKIPGNAPEDSRECSRRLRRMFQNIPGIVREDSGKCPGRFRGILLKIPGNVQEDSGEYKFRLFLEILLVFHQILLLNYYKTMEKHFLHYDL